MKKDTPEVMCHALRTLAYDITAPDDVPALCLRDAAAMIEELSKANAELRKTADNALRHVAMLAKTANSLGVCLSDLGVEDDMFNDPPSLHEWCEKRGAEYAELRKALEPFAALEKLYRLRPDNMPLCVDEITRTTSEPPDLIVSDLRAASRALEGGRP